MIKEVGDIVATIAAAIEEQSTVTKDIAGNIAQASIGVKDANERVAQTARVSQTIAKEIAEVNIAAGGISASSSQVQSSAEESPDWRTAPRRCWQASGAEPGTRGRPSWNVSSRASPGDSKKQRR